MQPIGLFKRLCYSALLIFVFFLTPRPALAHGVTPPQDPSRLVVHGNDKRGLLTLTLRDSIVPAAQQQPGFKGFVVLADPHGDKGIAYSIWETEADLQASETNNFYQEQIAKLKGVLATPPVREINELIVLA